MTIADSLLLLNNTKAAIKSAIEAKGVTVGTVSFASYADKIAAISDYVRPSDWIALPVLTATDNKFVGLYAVFPDANYVALSAAGAYTVDWGDGTVENIATGVTAQHEYNYATYDTGGATLCTRGYKQAIVTVTPQAGQSFTSLNLQIRSSALAVVLSTNWLDISVSGASLSSLNVGGVSAVVHSLLEIFSSIKNNISDFSNLLSSCTALKSIPIVYTSAGTNFSSMFNQCYALPLIPLIDTSLGTNFTSMFAQCLGLRVLPSLNTSSGLTFTSMFLAARSLVAVPALNMNSATTIGAFISGAYSASDVNTTNIGVSINISGLKLTAARLNEVFGNLKTTTGQTITITSCPGAATCDRTIATAKGWTVTG